MYKTLIILFTIFISNTVFSQEDPFATKPKTVKEKLEDNYYNELYKLQLEYRKEFSRVLLTSDKVEIYIVKFDGVTDIDPFSEDDEKIKISPYNKETKILKKKILSEPEKKKLLHILSQQIENKNQDDGALCHLPIHGIKAYKNNQIIFESTFCWKCSNFGFEYPQGNEWLSTNKYLEKVFNDLLPIPQTEIDRFENKKKKK